MLHRSLGKSVGVVAKGSQLRAPVRPQVCLAFEVRICICSRLVLLHVDEAVGYPLREDGSCMLACRMIQGLIALLLDLRVCYHSAALVSLHVPRRYHAHVSSDAATAMPVSHKHQELHLACQPQLQLLQRLPQVQFRCLQLKCGMASGCKPKCCLWLRTQWQSVLWIMTVIVSISSLGKTATAVPLYAKTSFLCLNTIRSLLMVLGQQLCMQACFTTVCCLHDTCPAMRAISSAHSLFHVPH